MLSVGGLARTLVVCLVIAALSTAPPPAAAADCSVEARTGLELSLEISAIRAPTIVAAGELRSAGGDYEAAVELFNDAFDRIRALPACNDEQARYKQLNIEFLSLYLAADACYYAYLADAGTIGQVNEWLLCISPVNAAIVATAVEMDAAHRAMLQSAPDASYREEPVPSVPTGVLYAQAVSAVEQLRTGVADARKLAQVISRGRDLLLSNASDQAVHLAMELVSVDQQATLAIGDVQLQARDSGVLRIRALPGSQRLLRGNPSVPEQAPAHQSPSATFRLDLAADSLGETVGQASVTFALASD
jgi:hypothetical protein